MKLWWLQAAVSLALAALLLAFVPFDRVWQALRSVNPWVWMASVVLFVIGHALNGIKLHVLLGSSSISRLQSVRAQFAGMAANLGLPGVAGGEVVRGAYLVKSAGVAPVTVASVADRLVDGVVVLLILLVATASAGLPDVLSARVPGWRGLLLFSVALIATASVVWIFRATKIIAAFGDAMRALLRRPGAMMRALAMSLGVQWGFVLTIAWLGREVGVHAPIALWFLAWTISRLSAILPISLGGLGVREAALVSVLGAYGASTDAVLATGLLWDGVIVLGSLGGFVLMRALPDRYSAR